MTSPWAGPDEHREEPLGRAEGLREYGQWCPTCGGRNVIWWWTDDTLGHKEPCHDHRPVTE